MDWIDGELGGGRGDGPPGGEGGWNWVNVGCIAFFVILAVIMFSVLGWLRDLIL
ncbi:hypothetical protein AB0A60_29310 [Streptomyces sp. NPDC046275]|uniref:hypothetical protein n=1 Tax=Streptomyces sp. NPDC046275 TaxID=3157201 RepID=UPI0033E64866